MEGQEESKGRGVVGREGSSGEGGEQWGGRGAVGREGSSESEEKQWTTKVHGTVVSNKARNGGK